jgi:hypothetical protein
MHAREGARRETAGMEDVLDLATEFAPIDYDCLRCGQTRPMRWRGLCEQCRDELQRVFAREQRAVKVADYEPKMNVTPNAVALKDD